MYALTTTQQRFQQGILEGRLIPIALEDRFEGLEDEGTRSCDKFVVEKLCLGLNYTLDRVGQRTSRDIKAGESSATGLNYLNTSGPAETNSPI